MEKETVVEEKADEFGQYCDAYSCELMGVWEIQCKYCVHKSATPSDAYEHYKIEHAELREKWMMIENPPNLIIEGYDMMMIEYDNDRFELVFDIPEFSRDYNVYDDKWSLWTLNVKPDNLGKTLEKFRSKNNVSINEATVMIKPRTNEKGKVLLSVWFKEVVANEK